MKKNPSSKQSESASELISLRIKELDDWRWKAFSLVRNLIKEADPEIVEELKWKKPSNPEGVPVWSHDGGICTGEIYNDHIKLTFFKGASLKDPDRLFNQDGTVRRAIDISEGDRINETAFKKLIREAVAFNIQKKEKR